MFMRTVMVKGLRRTVTECIPSSTTTTERGNRKKATSEEARRHNTTDRTTYSFLPQTKTQGSRSLTGPKLGELLSDINEVNLRRTESLSSLAGESVSTSPGARLVSHLFDFLMILLVLKKKKKRFKTEDKLCTKMT